MIGTDWRTKAEALAEGLRRAGDLTDPEWVAAVAAATPRHMLAPRAYQQREDGGWAEVDTNASGLAYSTTTLVTELDGSGRPVSSSTKPDLMVRMLEALDVRDGQRVLEIGTGRGTTRRC